MAANTLTAAAIAADAGAELAALVETYIVNEGDATAVLQAVADKIAADWVAGDASPLAIASAVWSASSRTITGGSLTTSPPTASAIADAVWDELRTGHTTSGTFGFYLDAAISGISGGSGGAGTGARTVTITVNDGTTALQNAIVRMTEGANTFTAMTNASGVCTFNLDDATYTVSITKSGYSYAGTTLVVDGTETATYSMTQITPSAPDDPALCAVTIRLRNQFGVDLAGEPVEITWVKWDTGAAETPPVLSVPPVQTTDSSGVVAVNLYREAVYKIVYGSAPYTRRIDVTIPNAGTYDVEV
jgi:hypothetical protein